jgi:hypothetical protein
MTVDAIRYIHGAVFSMCPSHFVVTSKIVKLAEDYIIHKTRGAQIFQKTLRAASKFSAPEA